MVVFGKEGRVSTCVYVYLCIELMSLLHVSIVHFLNLRLSYTFKNLRNYEVSHLVNMYVCVICMSVCCTMYVYVLCVHLSTSIISV